MTEDAEVAISVIVPAYQAADTLEQCVRSVLAQKIDECFEVIVVVSGDSESDMTYLANLPVDARLRIVQTIPRMRAMAARHVGADAARGRWLAFVDADATADPSWLRQLFASGLRENCVAGSIENGTPRSASGTSQYLLEFLDLHPRRPLGSVRHGATCNLGMPKSLWYAYAEPMLVPPEVADFESGDTLITTRAGAEDRLVFSPLAKVVHHNRIGFADLVRHQYRLGRSTAYLAQTCRVPWPGLTKSKCGAPIVALGRCASLWRRLILWRTGMMPRAAALSGYLTMGLGAWGWGLFTGNRDIRRGLEMTVSFPPEQ